ncbi:MAG: 23S rRNA (adenine(2503)-C(2))-methyltransferase RlmN, partial [Defluviitaleaceae bacterium]|nr:23S rRNA (adenine(2503)-C(2))-methyltransferase RlmN [Defluviitaleaceae bacterium]
MDKFDIRSAAVDEISDFMTKIGEKPYRGKQIFSWINNKMVDSFDEMTDLSKDLRQKLMQHAYIAPISIVSLQASKEDETKKVLFELQNYSRMDNDAVEAVLMHYKHGYSVCLSTQVGCAMACDFCASGLMGLKYNLTAGQMTAQFYHLAKMAGQRISNLVLMGIGEPLDNYDEVLKFISIINHPLGVNLGQRSITLSTCGLVPKIYRLAEEDLQINLAISLHAPNDQIRRRLMPIARKYDIDALLEACRAYGQNGRRITFEYIMLDGVNDHKSHAIELARRIKEQMAGVQTHVNIIPANDVPEKGYGKSSPSVVRHFVETLQKEGINTTVRRE